jgi:PAS domain S-box-containing protein
MELIARIITLLVNTDAVKADLVAADLTLQRAAQYETTAANAIREGLVLLSPELQVLIMNAAAEQIFGYRRKEVTHTTVENILIGNEKITPRLQEACDTLQAVRLDGVHLFRRFGETFPANVEALPLPLDGRLDRLLVIIQDLSESEQIREQARQLEQRALLGEFTAIFAHEVRNPINNISTGLELMAMNLPEDDSQQGLLQRLQQDCDRLAELMKSVLTFARPADTNLQPVQLPELVQKLIDRLAPRLEKAHVRQHLQVEGNIPVVMADYRALEQALNNIIQNAITAMGEAGGQLNLKIRYIKPTRGKSSVETRIVEISIADTGPGIPKEIQERIFQPFFTTSSSGNGLGLAITRRIINAHKGTIHLESFPGGTVFFIRLPPAEPE